MRQRDTTTTEPRSHSNHSHSNHGPLLTEKTITLPRRSKHTEHFSITRIKHDADQFDLIASTKGRTEHSATLVFPNISRTHARKLLDILTQKRPSAQSRTDPFPAVTIAADALVHADLHNLTVTTPQGRAGHDDISSFFDEEIKDYSMRDIQKMFRVEGLGNGIYHLSFPNRFLMNSCFLRLQEHFESPKYRGKLFSHDEFRAWYRTTREHKEFSYYTDWSGFNIPGYVLTSFLNGRFDPLHPGEQAVIETFRGIKGPLYIIGTLASDVTYTLRHELAHALYHTDTEYRAAVDRLLDGVNCTPLNRLLKSLGYHSAQWRDEAHAYLGDELGELESHGINSVPYAHVHRELLRLYNRHSPIPHHPYCPS